MGLTITTTEGDAPSTTSTEQKYAQHHCGGEQKAEETRAINKNTLSTIMEANKNKEEKHAQNHCGAKQEHMMTSMNKECECVILPLAA